MTYKRPEITEEMKKEAQKTVMEVIVNGAKSGVKTDLEKARTHIDKFYKTVLEKNGPKNIVLSVSPKAAIKAAMEVTDSSEKEVIRQLVFLNLWTYWPTRAWCAINIRGVNPKQEKIRDRAVDFTNEKFEMSKDVHAIICCSNTCFVVEFPTVFQATYDLKNFKLHRDGGLAIEYSDGTGFGYLNNVEVPDWVTCTPSEQLDTAKVMAISNVDVRREGLARIPNDKKIRDLNAKTLHAAKLGHQEWLDFELLDVDFKDGKTRKIFKALDPSSGKHIFERVEDDITTVEQAAAWRDGETKYIVPSKRT